MKIKSILSLLFLLFSYQGYSQRNTGISLQDILSRYENAENYEGRDSIWNRFVVAFEQSIQEEAKPDFSKIQEYIKDNASLRLTQSRSEDGRFITYSISRDFQNWNFVTVAEKNSDPKVILKSHDVFAWNAAIHSLKHNEFLLITRYDEMSYSCYVAYVMQLQSDGSVIRKDAFADAQDLLEVCSWTRLDNSYPVKDTITSAITIKGGLETYRPAAIGFDYKTKTLYFIKNDRRFKKAKYQNGRFNINGYHERTNVE